MTKKLKDKNNILIIAHRGCNYPGYVPNTLPAFQKVIEEKVSVIEFDVRKSINGDLFIFHDLYLDNTTNGVGKLSKRTTQYLKSIVVKNRDGISENIPLLEDLFKIIVKQKPNKRPLLNLEIKEVGTAQLVANLIKKYISSKKLRISDFLISSFIWRELFQIRVFLPEVKISFLSNAVHFKELIDHIILLKKQKRKRKKENLFFSLPKKFRYYRKFVIFTISDIQFRIKLYESLKMLLCGKSLYYKIFFSLGKIVNISGVHLWHKSISRSTIKKAHKYKFFVWGYTVNQTEDIKKISIKRSRWFFYRFLPRRL